MRIKRRTRPVIILSSLIIASVLALTTFGFYAYIEWKEKNIRRNYNLALHDLNGQLFAKYIIVTLQAKFDTEGIKKGYPVVLGTIKNNSNKKIYSVKLKLAFCDSKRRVVYVDRFYPIGFKFEPLVNISGFCKKTKIFLLEGDSISFKRRLKNCPPKVSDYLKARLKFAKLEQAEPLELVYKIEGVDIR